MNEFEKKLILRMQAKERVRVLRIKEGKKNDH